MGSVFTLYDYYAIQVHTVFVAFLLPETMDIYITCNPWRWKRGLAGPALT